MFHLTSVSLRILPLAVAAAAALRFRRLKHPAYAHAVWTAVMLGMLLLGVAGPLFKPLPLRVPAVLPAIPPGVAVAAMPAGLSAAGPAVSASRAPIPWSRIALYVYALIALGLLARLGVGVWLGYRLRAGSTPVNAACSESVRISIPLTVGLLAPRILLPSGWRNWDLYKLEAILAHEGAHVRRRDLLIAFLAGLNRCLFWFHPLAWWMERRLAYLAERACDEASLCVLNRPREYARVLLEIAAAATAAGGRLTGHALAMARPSRITRRIDAILDQSWAPDSGRVRWPVLLTCGIPLIYAAGTIRLEAQSRPSPVLLQVSVTDPRGRFVTGLNRENFRIFEDRAEQSIAQFMPANGLHAVGLVLDSGIDPSVARSFQGQLDPGDQSFVVEADANALFDGISKALAEAQQRSNPAKAVVVFAHGGPNHPVGPEGPDLELARQAAGIPIYFADFPDNAPPAAGYSQVNDFRAIATLTGGEYIGVGTPDDLDAAAARLAIRLANQYLLSYVPPNSTGVRPISIELVRVERLPPLQVIHPYGRYRR